MVYSAGFIRFETLRFEKIIWEIAESKARVTIGALKNKLGLDGGEFGGHVGSIRKFGLMRRGDDGGKEMR